MSQVDNSDDALHSVIGMGESGNQIQASTYAPGGNIVVGSSVINRLEDEKLVPLKKVEFQVLLEGDISNTRASRDLCLGFFLSGVVGLIGLVATIDWDEVFTHDKKAPAFWVLAICVVVAGSAVGAGIFQWLLRKRKQQTAYSSVVGRLRQDFDMKP